MSAQEIYNFYLQKSDAFAILQEMVKQFHEIDEKEKKHSWPDYCYYPIFRWQKLVSMVLKNDEDDSSCLAVLFSSLAHWHITQKVIKGIDYKSAIKDESLDSMDLEFLFEAVGQGAYVDFSGIEEYFSYQLFEGSAQGAFVSMNCMVDPILVVQYFSTHRPGEIPFVPYPMVMEVKGHTVSDAPGGWNVFEIRESSVRLKRILARYALEMNNTF